VSAHEFVTLDVFTDQPFTGNPLAVVADADAIDDDTMLSVAKEFGLSETVFLQTTSIDGCDVRPRIFTPGGELEFAGHPTIGTALWLTGTEGGFDGRFADASRITLEEGAGPVPVTISEGNATLTAPRRPELGPAPIDAPGAAALLGLDPAVVAGPPVLATAGNGFLVVELTSVDALAGLSYDRAAWMGRGQGAPDLGMVFAIVIEGDEVRARMFGPGAGIVEDPATGSAAAAVAAVLGQGRADGTHAWTIHQGVEMGRPSRIGLEVDVVDGAVTAARVAGTAVVVTRGTIELGAARRAPVR
jgi:trans-2,3-dihydro-3-hydroxyanthranilate isomerase